MKKATPRFRGMVDDDNGRPRIAIGNPARYHDYLRSLKKGEPVWVTVETEVNKRTLSQNNYYHMYLDMIADETGNTHDALHQGFRRTLLAPVFINFLGREIKIPRSTTDLSKGEFSEYLDRICAETGIPLPDPSEAGYITNY